MNMRNFTATLLWALLSGLTALLNFQPALAGDVQATLEPIFFGQEVKLVIVGSHDADDIRIIDDGLGFARIEGRDGTTINGKEVEVLVSEAGDFIGVEIDLGNGSDRLDYEVGTGARYFRSIDTGNGDDALKLSLSAVAPFVRVDTGLGNDDVSIDLTNTFVLHGFSVMTGLGDDWVVLRSDSNPFLYSSRFSTIETEQGDDVMQFVGRFTFVYLLYVSLGKGDDTVIGDDVPDPPGARRVEVIGGDGVDAAVNADYFEPYALRLFEIRDDL